jgi:acid phosphatase
MQCQQIDKDTTADFFYLDTTPMVRIYYNRYFEEPTYANVSRQNVKAQLDWFKQALGASKSKWKIVFAHHPIYSGGEHGDTGELIAEILPLLREHGVQAYFNGHDHDLQHLMAGNINLFCSGAGSQHRPTRMTSHSKFGKACSGFTTVSIESDKMNVCMIDNTGKVLYTTSIFRNSTNGLSS